MFDYEEACPVSKAASVLCERWTTQVCEENIRNDVDVYLTADLATFGKIWHANGQTLPW